jgi:hypothetical protein
LRSTSAPEFICIAAARIGLPTNRQYAGRTVD